MLTRLRIAWWWTAEFVSAWIGELCWHTGVKVTAFRFYGWANTAEDRLFDARGGIAGATRRLKKQADTAALRKLRGRRDG